jgi:hypothetical protein
MTTTYGDPRVIPQNIAFRQRDIPVSPEGSMVLQYDSADLPLSGIVVCRNTDDCRLMPISNPDVYEVNSYESLGPVEPSWLEAMQARPLLNYGALVTVVLGLVPIFLFSGWIIMKWRAKKDAG